jgi:Peptidase family M28
MIEPKNVRGPKGAVKHRWIGIVVAFVLGALAAVSLLALEPPDPLPASAPTNEFSSERAFSHVQQIAERPHPVGSEANVEVRDYLVGQLEDLGLHPTVQQATSARTMEGTASIARVHNIHARIPGSSPTGHVVLVAHYDSVPRGPGAADDGAGVAAILEIARVFTSGSPPRNDIDIVFTDAEEPWLLGAQAFVSAHRLDPQRSVVLNLEARGTSGPALMFQSSPNNATLIPALASAQRPIAGSGLWEACSQLLSGDTDFSVFRDAGFAGMNFAFMEGSARYHTPEDSPANLDHASLQHMGSTVLATARHFTGQDLDAPRGGSLTEALLHSKLPPKDAYIKSASSLKQVPTKNPAPPHCSVLKIAGPSKVAFVHSRLLPKEACTKLAPPLPSNRALLNAPPPRHFNSSK